MAASVHNLVAIRTPVRVGRGEDAGMDPWPRFERACLDRHGVGDADLARSHGVPPERYYRRTARERWQAPAPGVRLHPDATRSVQQRLLVVCCVSSRVAAASGGAAVWLHGLRDRPPKRLAVLCQHDTQFRTYGGVVVRRARWLDRDDVVERDHVPTLDVPAMLLSLLGRPRRDLLRLVIDAVHLGLTTPDAVLDRFARVGPVAGKQVLRDVCREVDRHRTESVFQHDVAAELERLGYRPERSTCWIPTPDGIGLNVDVALRAWKVAVEPDGDAYHRTREQRRRDRRREAAFAATDWVRVPVDWRDWHLDRDRVLRAIDDAIAAQRRRGIGAATRPPARGHESGS